MTNRINSTHTVLAILAVLVTVSPLAAAVKRRAVSMPKPSQIVKLTGKVLDATTGAAVVQAQVSAAGQRAATDASGQFSLNLPTSRSIALTISRVGYQTLTTALTLTGESSLNFTITPNATITVRLRTGSTVPLDTETVEFGYIAPFSGFVKDSKMSLCKPGGEPFTPDRSEIRRITPGAELTDAACCSRGPVPSVDVELKSGQKTTAALTDACFGYEVDVIGLRHDTAVLVNIHISDVTEIVFP